ncbi:MAG: DctP family TRAP transporter solute-binding subunit [Planctomycetota bacterium]|jgi:C4-dicarboxylate-binding protein DctP
MRNSLQPSGKIIKSWLGLFACLALLGGTVKAEPEYVIKYSHAGSAEPRLQSSSAAAVVFKAQLEKLSGGRIRVDVHPAGQLANLRSSVSQVRKGTIQIADISSGVLASLYYEPLEILDMPYLFSSRATARLALDRSNPVIARLIEDCAEKTGVRILSLDPFGFRHMTNNARPIRTPADMKGLKIRTMEIVAHRKLMESFGATAVPMPWLELYTSLQTNVVDGEETTLQNMVMGRLYQVQKHLTLTEHLMGVGAILCNEEGYQSLPDDLRTAVVEAEEVARLTYAGYGELLDTLAFETLEDEGVQIYSPSTEQMKLFRDAAVPHIREYMETSYGEQLVSEFLASVEAAEKQIQEQAEATAAKHKQKERESSPGSAPGTR